MVTAFKRLFSSEQQSVTGAAILIGASSLLSRVLGVLRERLLVGAFGVGDRLDAYYASFQVPNFLYNLLILGTLSVALIPVFAEWYERDKQEAWKIASGIFSMTVTVMGICSALIIVFAGPFTHMVAPGFGGEKLTLAISLTRLMAFSPFLFALSSVFGSVLNARKHFFAGAVAPLVYNAAILIGILIGGKTGDIHFVSWAVLAGAGGHAAVQGISAILFGFRIRRGFALSHPGVRNVWRLFFPRIWGIDISQISLLIGSMIGSMLLSGSVALFNLASNIEALPVSVLGTSFAIAVFPVFSQTLARGDRGGFLELFSRTGRQILFFLLPVGAITIVLRAHIIRLVIGTDKLSWDETRLAAAALAFFAASLWAQGLTPLFSRAFYALKNTVVPVVISTIAVFMYIASAYGVLAYVNADPEVLPILVRALRLNGIADIRMLALPFAFSVASFAQLFLLAFALRRLYGHIDGRRLAYSVVKTAAGAMVALLVARLGLLLAVQVVSDRTFLGVLIQAIVSFVLSTSSFFLVVWLLRSEEASLFFASWKGKALKITRPLGIGDATDMG
jgi:putative peptidoglycan lipid II flippase